MKIYSFILAIASFVLFTSCSSDDDSSGSNNSSPVGSYELISIKVSKPIDADNDGSYDDIELINHVACNSSVVLNENKTFVWESLNVYQMNFNGEAELFCHNYMEPGNYELTENSLQLACDHDEFFLMNLTGNEIKYITTDYFETSNNNGETLTVTYTYKK